MKTYFSTVFIMILALGLTHAQQHEGMPPDMTHAEHLLQLQRLADLKTRGREAMGFDQDKTTHHFRLTVDGGIIQVEVNDSADDDNLKQIRTHLAQIAAEFRVGTFQKPQATHDEVPPGVSEMQRLKSEIRYAFEETPHGAMVRIRSTNSEAIKAIHEFLRYQIKEHVTGDSLTQP